MAKNAYVLISGKWDDISMENIADAYNEVQGEHPAIFSIGVSSEKHGLVGIVCSPRKITQKEADAVYAQYLREEFAENDDE